LLQRFLCRVCGYRFSQSIVKVNVVGNVGETFDSGNNDHEVRVVSGSCSDEKVYDGLPFSFGEDVGSHDISNVEKGLNDLPFYNRKTQVCAQKDAKNLNNTTETKTVARFFVYTPSIKRASYRVNWRVDYRLCRTTVFSLESVYEKGKTSRLLLFCWCLLAFSFENQSHDDNGYYNCCCADCYVSC